MQNIHKNVDPAKYLNTPIITKVPDNLLDQLTAEKLSEVFAVEVLGWRWFTRSMINVLTPAYAISYWSQDPALATPGKHGNRDEDFFNPYLLDSVKYTIPDYSVDWSAVGKIIAHAQYEGLVFDAHTFHEYTKGLGIDCGYVRFGYWPKVGAPISGVYRCDIVTPKAITIARILLSRNLLKSENKEFLHEE